MLARVLDLFSGSGCFGIACAVAFEDAQVDLSDISPKALAVARRNVEKHVLGNQVRVIKSDVFDGLVNEVYDLIVANPPYVPTAEWKALATEYRNEPKLALAAGGEDRKRVVSGKSVYVRVDLGGWSII